MNNITLTKTNIYRGCESLISGDENQKKEMIQRYENEGGWIAEPKKDGIWYGIFGEGNSKNTGYTRRDKLKDDKLSFIGEGNSKNAGYTRRGKLKDVKLPFIGEGNIIIGELAESTEKALERKKEVGHTFVDVFDILRYNHIDVYLLPLFRRKNILQQWWNNLPDNAKEYFNLVKFSNHNFVSLYEKEEEGIVLKYLNSNYFSFTYPFIKVKKEDTWDFVVMNYVLSDADSKSFAKIAKSIVAGQYVNGKLIPLVKIPVDIDLGYKIVNQFSKLKNSVVEVKGFSRTKKGSVRSPRFVRFREDKSPKECILL